MKVDRGDRVKVGQVLARIFDPELDVAVLQAQASLEHAQAMVTQSDAKLKTALAGVQAAEAQQTSANAKLDEAVAQRTYRKRALDRITDLASRNAVEQKLVDESEDQYMSARASELAAQAGIKTAEAQYAEATAAVDLAQADIVTAKSEVAVARANLNKANVMVDYTRIESPYDGVVTQRGDGIHKGAFVRSASEGNQDPLLTVARTDLMRVIVQVPDRDVPFVDSGDPAFIKLDSLPDRVFSGRVSRISEAEDLKDRAMRVEIDLVNDAKVLRDGMYGRVSIVLEPPSKNLTIPSPAVIEQNGKGEAAVYVVREGKIHRAPIKIGKDNGLNVEVLSGLTADDQVVVRSGPVSEGSSVKAELLDQTPAESKESSH